MIISTFAYHVDEYDDERWIERHATPVAIALLVVIALVAITPNVLHVSQTYTSLLHRFLAVLP